MTNFWVVKYASGTFTSAILIDAVFKGTMNLVTTMNLGKATMA